MFMRLYRTYEELKHSKLSTKTIANRRLYRTYEELKLNRNTD